MAGSKRARRREKAPIQAPSIDESLLGRVALWRESLARRKAEIAATPGLKSAQVTAEQGVLQPRIELGRIEARRVIREPARASERALLAMATIHILDDVSIEDLDRAYQQRPKAFELACRTRFERLIYQAIRR